MNEQKKKGGDFYKRSTEEDLNWKIQQYGLFLKEEIGLPHSGKIQRETGLRIFLEISSYDTQRKDWIPFRLQFLGSRVQH